MYGDDDQSETVMVNKSRKAAMKNIWFLLIWLTVVAVESFLYSIFSFYLSGDMCEPEHISQAADSFIEFIDRFLNY